MCVQLGVKLIPWTCTLLRKSEMYFDITSVVPVSENVVRVEGSSADGAVIAVDIVRCLCADIAVGNTVHLDIGAHTLAYAVNAVVVAMNQASVLASYGGLAFRLDGGIPVDLAPSVGSQLKLSLSCIRVPDCNKRARCVA